MPHLREIERTRLLEKLQEVPRHRLTLIAAPPGYGKTTLANQFVHHCSYPVAWHTLSERERDLPVLVARNLVALETIAPGIQGTVPSANPSAIDAATLIADYLHTGLSDDAIYVLDDVHHLVGALAAEAWLRSLVALLPATCHLVLISRTVPDLPFEDLVAHHKLLTLGPEDLRFSSQEVRQLAVEMLGQELPAEQVRDLEMRLEGWPAGTVLAFWPLPSVLERIIRNGQTEPEALFNTLSEAMLKHQPPDVREFLLISSALHILSPEACQAVLELEHSDELLAEIQARNLFVSRVRGGLTYHLLFRDFLQRHLRQTDPARFMALHIRAAQYFEAHEEPDEAFDHYITADRPDQAATIANDLASVYYRAGRVETLLHWLERLKSTTERPSHLLYIGALIHMARYDFAVAKTYLDAIEDLYQAQGAEADLAEVDLQRASLDLLRGQYSQALRRAGRLLATEPTSPIVQMRALNTLGHAQLYVGQVEAAVENLQEALALHRAHSDAYGTAQVLQTLALACYKAGHLTDAISHLQETVALLRAFGATRDLAYALNNLGAYYHRASQYEPSQAAFTEALNILVRFPDRRTESYLLSSLAGLRRDLGDFDEALNLYRRGLERLGDGEPAERCLMLVGLSMLKRWQGRWAEAETMALEAVQVAEQYGLVAEGWLAQANRWVCHAYHDQRNAAGAHLTQIAHQLRAHHARYELVQVLGLSAVVAAMGSPSLTVRQRLRDALALAEDIGTAQPVAVEVLYCPRLATLVNGTSLLAHDLDALRAAQTAQTHRVGRGRVSVRLPFCLRVLSLGQENLIRDGKVVSTAAWRALKARELFFYLLFVGPSRREALCALFWPESAPERVRANFHATLHHARQALGADTLTFDEGLYQINSAVEVWCDAYQLEHLVVQARMLAPHDVKAEDLWRRATELYKGDFLPSLDAEWIVTHREKLSELYLEALIGLGQCLRSRGDLSAALDVFKRAIAVDPYREDIHRTILSCYAEKGQRQKIHAHFRRLERLLRVDLDVEPSVETRALVAALLK